MRAHIARCPLPLGSSATCAHVWKYTRDTCAATCPSLPQQYLPSRASVLSQRGRRKECLSSAALFFIASRTEVWSTPGRELSTFIVFCQAEIDFNKVLLDNQTFVVVCEGTKETDAAWPP